MGVASPELIAAAFEERFNAGDLGGMIELYAEDAVFTYDGIERAVGRAQIEKALAGFIMGGLKFRAQNVATYVTGDTALTRFNWELTDPAGAVAASGISVEVQRRDQDGIWRLVIDDTNGGSRT